MKLVMIIMMMMMMIFGAFARADSRSLPWKWSMLLSEASLTHNRFKVRVDAEPCRPSSLSLVFRTVRGMACEQHDCDL